MEEAAEDCTRDPLYERFPTLARWLMTTSRALSIDWSQVAERLPSYLRAIWEQAAVMEAAFFARHVTGMEEASAKMKAAETNIKRFVERAAARLNERRKETA